MTIHPLARGLSAAALFLVGCAAHVVPPPVVLTSPMTGRLETGVVVAVRPVDPGQDVAVTNAILSALGTSQGATPAANTIEIIIRRQDNSVTSIVQRQLPGQAGFTPGETIAIVEAASTIVRPE